MSDNTIRCGNCGKEIELNKSEFLVGATFVGENGFKMLAICERCCRLIPESMRVPKNHTTVDKDTLTICKAEKVSICSTFTKPLFDVRKSVVNFCISSFGRNFWPKTKL